jgi:hypothetical protein
MKLLASPIISVAGIIINFGLCSFNIFIDNQEGAILNLFCAACFIVSYWVNTHEKKDK